MHAATLASPRLQRVLALLSDGRPHTTRQIVRGARVMAVSACIAELRACGAEILCQRRPGPPGFGPRFYYTLIKRPEA
jgi:hypothetical protein